MKCERCGKNEGEYLCSVCNRVVCESCKVKDSGKIYCLDHVSKKELVQKETKPSEPMSLKIIKELIYTDIILLIGIVVIFAISNFFIHGLLIQIAQQASEAFPQLSFVFALLIYFESTSMYAIITLVIILIILAVTMRNIKKRRDKNI